MFVLKHGNRQQKPYIRNISVGLTGFDISYCEEVHLAMTFVSRSVAIHIAKSLNNYGIFYPIKMENV